MTWRRLLWVLVWVGAAATFVLWVVGFAFVLRSGSLIGPRPPAP